MLIDSIRAISLLKETLPATVQQLDRRGELDQIHTDLYIGQEYALY